MSKGHRVLVITLAIGAIAASAAAFVAFKRLQEIQAKADDTAASIHQQLDDLDPVTRAAVIARLTKDAAAEAEA